MSEAIGASRPAHELFTTEGVPTETKWISTLIANSEGWAQEIASALRDPQTATILNVGNNVDRPLYSFIHDGISLTQNPAWASDNESAKQRMDQWLATVMECFPARAEVSSDVLVQMKVDLEAYANQIDQNVIGLRNRGDITDSDAEHMGNVVRAMRAAAEPMAQVAELLNQNEIACLQLNADSI